MTSMIVITNLFFKIIICKESIRFLAYKAAALGSINSSVQLCDRHRFINLPRKNTALFLRSTLGERNPNLKLDGLPVLYIPRCFEVFVRGLQFGRPSWFLQGPASFSNLADLMVEFRSDSFSWLSVAVALG